MSRIPAGDGSATRTELTVCPHCGGDLSSGAARSTQRGMDGQPTPKPAPPMPPPLAPRPLAPPLAPPHAPPPLAPPTVPMFILPHTGIECPRCGYDLHGTVRAWTDRCPIHGNCPECGLHFDWSHVFVVSKYEPKWCIEFVVDWPRTFAAVGKTLVRSGVPWMFWKALNMSSPVRWHRLRLYVLMLLALIALVYCSVQALRATVVYSAVGASIRESVARAQGNISEAQVWISSIEMGETRFADAFRAPAELARLRQMVANNQAIIDTPPVIEHSYFAALGEATLLPSSDTSAGVIRHNDGRTNQYPAPTAYFNYLGRNLRPPFVPSMATTATTIGLGMILVAMLPATFVLLPASRRKAKVQWRHIGRIGMYSFGLPAVVCAIIILAQGFSWLPATMDLVPGFVWSLPGLLWLIMPIWWWAAIRNYLRMPHAGAIAFLMTIMILLLVGPIVLAMMPAWLEDALVAW